MNRTFLFRSFLIFSLLFSIWSCQYQSEFEDGSLFKKEQRLIGGTPDLRYPAVGALTILKRPFCTAALIRPDVVLTAAHCIDAAKRYQSRSKVQFRVDFPQGKGFRSEFHDILSMVNHPNYKNTVTAGMLADIGLIFLKKPVSNVTPIPFNRSPLGQSWVKKKLLFLGYGLIQTRPVRVTPSQKYGLPLTIDKMYQDRIELYDYKKSLCSGDSGGPSLAKIKGKLYVLSVNSYGLTTSQGSTLFCDGGGVAFRTDTFANWLDEIIAKHGVRCSGDLSCGSCYSCSAAKTCTYKAPPVNSSQFCQPCRVDSDCKSKGFLCAPVDQGYRCLPSCKGTCCPKGTYCRTFTSPNQATIKSCVPNVWKCPDVRCAHSTECGRGEVCDSGVCKAKVSFRRLKLACERCQKDSDCMLHSVCMKTISGRVCLRRCISKNLCRSSGWKCSSLGGENVCLPISGSCPCVDSSQCLKGLVCRAGKCEKQGLKKKGEICSVSGECLAPLVCVQGGNGKKTCLKECDPLNPIYPKGFNGSSCHSNGSCKKGLFCARINRGGNMCFQHCQGSGLCPNGGRCGGPGGRNYCLCRKDSDCKVGYGCNKSVLKSTGVCAKKTTSHFCDKNESCLIRGNRKAYCLSNLKCKALSDCKAGFMCLEGLCVFDKAYCSSKSDCLLGWVCQLDVHTCMKPRKNCFSDKSCFAPYTCVKNRCIARKCSGDNDCLKGQICTNQICQRSTVKKCERDIECPSGYQCSGGSCKKRGAKVCQSGQDCPSGLICQKLRCMKPECTRDAECSSGKVCRSNRCVKATIQKCTRDAECPSEQWCFAGFCKKRNAGACRTAKDCSRLQACISGSCKDKGLACKIVQDCPIGHRCVNKSCVRDPYGACRIGNCPWGHRCRSYGSRSLCDRDWSVCAAELPCKGGLVCQFGACIHSSEVVESSNEPSTNTEPFERLKFDASTIKESKAKTDKKRWAVPNAFRKNLPRLAVSRGCTCAQSKGSVPFGNLLWLGGISLLILLRKPRRHRS